MPLIPFNRRQWLAAAATTAVFPALPAIAQPVASGVLILMVPQPAGNPTDAFARKLQPMLQKELGQTVVVENVAGAGGAIGVAKALRAPPSSPMLLLASQTESILTPFARKDTPFQSEQLRPVALLSRGVYALMARPDLPATSLAELVSLARERGASNKPLALGHIGNGSMQHLMSERLAARTKIPLTMVPYKGVSPVVQDLMGGQIDLAFMPMGGPIGDLLTSGKLKALGSTGTAPTPKFPKVRPLAQQDKSLADFDYETWAGVFVAREASEPLVGRLRLALSAALNDSGFQAFIVASGGELVPAMTAAQLDTFYQAEIRRYQQMSREIGVIPE